MNMLICFIGGTARSGSTLLDLILANDPKAMSLGEINALFRPTRKHHFEEIKKLMAHKIWSQILQDKKRNLYPNLIKYFPEIDIFVDSSKDPFWFIYHEQCKYDYYDIKHVLIYKSPAELAQSLIKRGQDKEWAKAYKHYHKKYFSLITDFLSISYKDLVSTESALITLCNQLGLIHFETKKNYWEKEQLSFFGSNSVKSKAGHSASKQLSDYKRKEVAYDVIQDKYILRQINKVIRNDREIKLIEQKLNSHNIMNNIMNDTTFIKYTPLVLKYHYMKQLLKQNIRYYIPQNYFVKKND